MQKTYISFCKSEIKHEKATPCRILRAHRALPHHLQYGSASSALNRSPKGSTAVPRCMRHQEYVLISIEAYPRQTGLATNGQS